ALGDVDHVADEVAHLPVTAACGRLPVLRGVDDRVELAPLGTHYVENRVFGAVVHRIDCHGQLLLLLNRTPIEVTIVMTHYTFNLHIQQTSHITTLHVTTLRSRRHRRWVADRSGPSGWQRPTVPVRGVAAPGFPIRAGAKEAASRPPSPPPAARLPLPAPHRSAPPQRRPLPFPPRPIAARWPARGSASHVGA